MNKVVHSSMSVMWETPQDFFDKYNKIYQFNTDVCATPENAKCAHFYTPEIDGLKQEWNGVCWMNPPYSRIDTPLWVQKAFLQMMCGVKTVALLPSRTDTKWFHDYIYNKPNITIEFIKGRLKFGNSKDGAPFPSMIVVFGSNIRTKRLKK